MKLDYLSYSTLQNWLKKCQRPIYEKKENGIIVPFSSKHTSKGQAFHKAFEVYYEAVKNKKSLDDPIFISAELAKYTQDAKERKEWLKDVMDFIAKRPYKEKNILGTEVSFDCLTTKEGVVIHGFVDLVYEDGDSLYCVDFKTDFMIRDYSIQKLVYSVAMRYLYPGYSNYYFVLDFVYFDAIEEQISDNEFEENSKELEIYWTGMIEANIKNLIYRPGQACASCPENAMKECRYYKLALQYKKVVENPDSAITDELLEERKTISSQMKLLDERLNSINETIRLAVGDSDELITESGIKIKMVPNRRYSFPTEKLFDQFGKKILSGLTISKTSLAKLLDKDEFEIAQNFMNTAIGQPKILIKHEVNDE